MKAVPEPVKPKDSIFAEGLVTVKEAANILGVGQTTLYGLMDSGRLAYCKIGSARRIPKRLLYRFMRETLVGRIDE